MKNHEKIFIFFILDINFNLSVSETTPSKGPDDTDTDLRLTGTDINVIDPISKMRMTDPVRNAICGHIYDRESLMAMLQKNNKTRFACYAMLNIVDGSYSWLTIALCLQMSCSGMHQHRLYKFEPVSHRYRDKIVPGQESRLDLKEQCT